jgi:hypothetical protein
MMVATTMRAADLSKRYGELLAQSSADPTAPAFEALWHAFIELAAEPVDEVYRAGSEDDELEVSFTRDPDTGTSRLGLDRRVVLATLMQLFFYVECEFPGVQLDGDPAVLGLGGSVDSAARFAAEVEALPCFSEVGSGTVPSSFRVAQDLEE